VSDEHGHACCFTGTKLGTSVESEPADPEQGGTDHDETRAVRGMKVVGELLSRADHFCQDECGDSSGGVNYDAACEVNGAPLHHEASTPYPVNGRCIDEDKPEGGEDHDGAEFHPLDKGSNDQSRSDDGKSHLEHDEDGFGEIAFPAFSEALEEEFVHPSEPATAPRREGDAVEADHPHD